MRRKFGNIETHVFPTQDPLTFDAVDVAHGVVACRHLTINWFSLHDIDAGDHKGAELVDNVRYDESSTHTVSNRYARPCCPLNAWEACTLRMSVWLQGIEWRSGLTLESMEWMVARWVLHSEQP